MKLVPQKNILLIFSIAVVFLVVASAYALMPKNETQKSIEEYAEQMIGL